MWEIPIFKFVENKNMVIFPFDVIILLSFLVSNDILLTLKNNNVKNVLYSCGNDHFINCEHVLYNRPGNLITTCIHKQPTLEQVWIIPQMVNTTLQYHKTFQRCKCVEVPFIWSHVLLDEISKKNNKDFKYAKRPGLKKLGIFEPNLSIMKWAMPAILVCENAYRIVPDKIKHVYVTNVTNAIESKRFEKEPFEKLISTFDLRIDSKISIEGRYNIMEFMSEQQCDIAVSYQMENNLNYLYLDLAWMGWPVVHNANLCKDIGYYYEDFDYEMGGKVLVNTIMFHDDNDKEYMEKNRKLIDRYLPTNKILQSKYTKLIDDLFV